MININTKTLMINEPALPLIERADLAADYPLDAPVPRLMWRVSLQCGDYGGSYGQGYTLREALAHAATQGWTPVRRVTVTIRADRYDARLRTAMALEYHVLHDVAWRGPQRLCDAAAGTARMMVIPTIEGHLARLRGEQATA